MDKLTRTQFSYNTKEGACPECQGLGQTLKVDRTGAVDERRSLEDGAVRFGHRNTLNTRRVRFMRLCGIMGSCTAGDGSRSIQRSAKGSAV